MNSTSNGAHKLTNWGLILTVPVCVILAILFIISSVSESGHPITAEPLEPVWYTPQTARGDDLKNKVMVGNCYLCHAYWVGIPDPDVVRPEFTHGVIKLNHGANDRCYNCHLIQDRNKYAANDGSGIHRGIQILPGPFPTNMTVLPAASSNRMISNCVSEESCASSMMISGKLVVMAWQIAIICRTFMPQYIASSCSAILRRSITAFCV